MQSLAGRALAWFSFFFLLWVLISAAQGWLFGIAAAAASAALILWLGVPWPRIRLRQLPVFSLFFFKELVLGGWDVTRRILHPQLPLEPTWVSYHLTRHNPRIAMPLSVMVGLLPGTLCSRYHHNELTIHTLDGQQDWYTTVAQLEQHLDRLLKAPIP